MRSALLPRSRISQFFSPTLIFIGSRQTSSFKPKLSMKSETIIYHLKQRVWPEGVELIIRKLFDIRAYITHSLPIKNDVDRSLEHTSKKKIAKRANFSPFLCVFISSSVVRRFVWILHFKFNPLSMQFVCIYGIFIQFSPSLCTQRHQSIHFPSSDLE